MTGEERPRPPSQGARRAARPRGPLRLRMPADAPDPPRALLVVPSRHDGAAVVPDDVAGGPLPTLLTHGGMVVAVDGGVADLRAIGCVPDVLVGDLDSASPDDVGWAERAGAEIQRHPTDKDATDLDLALHFARRQGARVVDVVGSGGGRLDHLLGTVLACTAPDVAPMTVVVHLTRPAGDAPTCLAVLHGEGPSVEVDGGDGRPFSLLAPRGAEGVTVTGARWPLEDADLAAGSTLGISNEVDGTARVACRRGPLVVVVG